MTLDNGMTVSGLAYSLMRVYAGCVSVDGLADDELMSLVLDGESGNGWLAAAGVLAGEYQASVQAEVTIAVADLTRRVQAAFYEGADLPLAGLAFDGLAPRVQLAWEAATRHGAGAVGCDDAEAANLLSGESVWRPWLLQTAANRGIDLG